MLLLSVVFFFFFLLLLLLLFLFFFDLSIKTRFNNWDAAFLHASGTHIVVPVDGRPNQCLALWNPSEGEQQAGDQAFTATAKEKPGQKVQVEDDTHGLKHPETPNPSRGF